MTELENEEVLHAIYYERYKTGLQNDIIDLIDKACDAMKKELRRTRSVSTKARYNEVARVLKEISGKLSGDVTEAIDVEGVVDYEIRKQKKLFGGYGGKFNYTFPTAEQIVTSVVFRPYAGETFQAFMNDISASFYNTWDASVRTGYMLGQTTDKIIRNVVGAAAGSAQLAEPGTIQRFINSVTLNTRTALQSFASATRDAIYVKNKDAFEGYRWLATLDRRTCLVCASYDGKFFRELKKAPETPLHYNCRCLLIPELKINIPSEERASEFGPVDGDTTFKGWLQSQPENVQRDVLGESRYRLYKEGKADLSVFVQDGRVLTLKELEGKL